MLASDAGVGIQVKPWGEHESALPSPRMRQRELRVSAHARIEVDDVEVKGA